MLMWSHYAENHRGVCLGYRAIESLKQLEDVMKTSGVHPWQVSYVDEVPIFHLRDLARDPARTSLAMLSTKARFWEYEREWRLLGNMMAQGDKYIPCPFSLSKVIFGARIGPEEEGAIRHILGTRFPAPSFLRCKKRADAFGVSIEPA